MLQAAVTRNKTSRSHRQPNDAALCPRIPATPYHCTLMISPPGCIEPFKTRPSTRPALMAVHSTPVLATFTNTSFQSDLCSEQDRPDFSHYGYGRSASSLYHKRTGHGLLTSATVFFQTTYIPKSTRLSPYH